MPWGPSTVRAELARLEEARAARASAHLGRPRADRPRLPLLRRRAARARASCPVPHQRVELERDAARGRRGDARHHRAALAGDEPAGARDGAADRDGHDPPRRGAAAPAAGGDGRRDHLDRRRDQARDLLRGARSTPALVDWAASYLNEALGGLDVGSRHAACASSTDPELRRAERDFLATLAPAFTELEQTAEDTLYMEGAARLLSEHRFQELSQIAGLMQVLEHRRRAARRAARVARPSRASTCASARRTRRRSCSPLSDRRRQLRARPAQPRRRRR